VTDEPTERQRAPLIPIAALGPAQQRGEDGFAALGLDGRLLRSLAALGYEEPTPVQREAIPPLMAGRDLLAEAPTGTGKTAAFALPILQHLATALPSDPARRGRPGEPWALVLVPTRELAMQVAEAIHRYGRELGLRVLPVYGGQPIGIQLRTLGRPVDVVVATPGRAVDHLNRGSMRLAGVSHVVLDEADEMLDMGFAEDLEAILGQVPAGRQAALFSATIPRAIRAIADRHLADPVRLSVRPERPAAGEQARVRQVAYVVRRADKLLALCRILDLEDPGSALVFARTRGEVDDLADALAGRGHDAAALHGGLDQPQRDRILGRFREGALDVLVATDVAARGLDIEHVSHVVNYDVPSSPEAYVHRIGRTGRAGREGVAITLVEPREHRLLRAIERTIGRRLELERVPTVADLRERRFEVLRASLRETLLGDGFDRYRGVVEPLADEFDAVDIALAAVSMADATSGDAPEEREIPPARLPTDEPPQRAGRPGPARAARAPGAPGRTRPRPADARRAPIGDMTRIFVGAGRSAGMRPADLVGAIANEAGLPGDRIGAIQVAENFSLVEVPEAAVEQVISALRAATVKGRKVTVRRERY